MVENGPYQADDGSAAAGKRSIVRELLLEAAIDDIFEVLADQPFLEERAKLDPTLVASAKRTAVRVMSDPTPEETAEFWSVYAALILAVERPEPASAGASRPAARPPFLVRLRDRTVGRFAAWMPGLSGQLAGATIVAIAATIVVYSVFQGRPVSAPAGVEPVVVANAGPVPAATLDNAGLPMIGVLAGDLDPGLAAIYHGSHEGQVVPGIAVADETPGLGEFLEPEAMEPLRLLPNAVPDPIASVPFVHRSPDESVSFPGDYNRPGA